MERAAEVGGQQDWQQGAREEQATPEPRPKIYVDLSGEGEDHDMELEGGSEGDGKQSKGVSGGAEAQGGDRGEPEEGQREHEAVVGSCQLSQDLLDDGEEYQDCLPAEGEDEYRECESDLEEAMDPFSDVQDWELSREGE